MNFWEHLNTRKANLHLRCLERVMPNNKLKRFQHVVWFGLFAMGVGLILLPWRQTAQGNGKVVAYHPNERPQTISAPLDGRIQKWHVAEGSKVKKGEPLLELIDNDPELLSRIRAERDAISRRAKAASDAVKTAEINIRRQKQLLEHGLSAPRSVELAQLDYNRLLVEEANSLAELARIDVRLARQLTQTVPAPIDGTILKVSAGQGGQLVKQGDALAVLIPTTESRAVEIWIDGNDMPLVQEGKHVRLQFEGWPAIQFSGWPSVAVGTFGGEVHFIDAADNGSGKFRIVVFPSSNEPWPSARFLRQGVRVHGWVQLETVSLGFEVWRRFNGFPPSVRDFDEASKNKETAIKPK